jgi:hypothetical protein
MKSEFVEIKGWQFAHSRWNVDQSFHLTCEAIHDIAKKILVADGRHSQTFILFTSDGTEMVIIPKECSDYGYRDVVANIIKSMITESVIGVIQISEAWVHTGTQDAHITKQLQSGEIRVSELLPEHRQEVLITVVQSRDGQDKMWMDYFVKDSEDKISFDKEEVTTEKMGGRFGNFFG